MSRKESKRVFPEVAWLYDPPRETSGGAAAGEALLRGRMSNEHAAPLGSHPSNAEMRQYAERRPEGARSVEPLLPPMPAATRDNSPAGSERSRGNSPGAVPSSRHAVPGQSQGPRIDLDVDRRPLAGMWDVPPGWAR